MDISADLTELGRTPVAVRYPRPLRPCPACQL